jgi:hypothetical protein
MEERTTHTSVTFSHPFTLTGIEGSQPAGIYRIETVDVLLDNASCLNGGISTDFDDNRATRRGRIPPAAAMSAIDSLELEAALRLDAADQAKPTQRVSE